MTGEDIEMWFYPLAAGDTLASNEWVELHIHKLLTSRFVAYALRDGRRDWIGTALLLWAECYRQDPAGTLPDDDVELAQLARFGADVEAWIAVRDGVLHGWRKCYVDNGGATPAVRLGHPFIAEIATRSVRRRNGRVQSREAARLAVIRSRVRAKMKSMPGLARLAEAGHVVDAVVRWLDESHLYVTDDNIRAAVDQVQGVPRVVAARGERRNEID